MNKCPFCGAEEVSAGAGSTIYDCHTSTMKYAPYYHRRMLCYERELAAIKERLETHKAERKRLLAAIEWRDEDRGRLEELLEAWRRHWREDSGNERHFTEALNRLKALGEI